MFTDVTPVRPDIEGEAVATPKGVVGACGDVVAMSVLSQTQATLNQRAGQGGSGDE